MHRDKGPMRAWLRGVGKSHFQEINMDSNDKKRTGFVSIIGRPNVGKSTLMNAIVGEKIAITSDKPQTTRNRIRSVYTDDRMQIVFVDTPGIHKSANKLGDYMVKAAKSTVNDADVIYFMVEPGDYIGQGEKEIIRILKTVDVPVFLIVNKIDKVERAKLMEFIATYANEMEWTEVIPLSALKKDNIEELLKTTYKYLPEGIYMYDPDTLTDQPERQIVAELIREKMLRLMKDEVPHGVAVAIDSMKFSKNIVNIDATIYCERESHKGIIIGKGGQMLKAVGSRARVDIEKMLDKKVNLKLWVKVKDNWRDSDYSLKNFGFQDGE